jgi:hypothetical protein
MTGEPSHRVSFGGSDGRDSDLATRTERLEQQINSLTQELASLRQELAQLRTNGPVQTGYNAQAPQSTPPQPPQDRYNEAQKIVVPPPTAPPIAPPAINAPPEAAPAKPTAEAAKPTPPPAAPATPPAPAAEKSSSNDPFGSDSAPSKAQEKPKTEEKPKADDKASDDLFK